MVRLLFCLAFGAMCLCPCFCRTLVELQALEAAVHEVMLEDGFDLPLGELRHATVVSPSSAFVCVFVFV